MERVPEDTTASTSEVTPGREFEIRWFDAWAQFCKQRWGNESEDNSNREPFVPMTGVEAWALFCKQRYGPKPEVAQQVETDTV